MMHLILKARMGLVAKKITAHRKGKPYQQTVWVRAGEKDESTHAITDKELKVLMPMAIEEGKTHWTNFDESDVSIERNKDNNAWMLFGGKNKQVFLGRVKDSYVNKKIDADKISNTNTDDKFLHKKITSPSKYLIMTNEDIKKYPEVADAILNQKIVKIDIDDEWIDEQWSEPTEHSSCAGLTVTFDNGKKAQVGLWWMSNTRDIHQAEMGRTNALKKVQSMLKDNVKKSMNTNTEK